MNNLAYWMPLIKTLAVVLSFFMFCVMIAKIIYAIIIIKKIKNKENKE